MKLPGWRPGPLTVVLLPEGGRESRTIRLSRRVVQVGTAVALLLAIGGATMTATWWFLATRAYHAVRLEAQVDSLQAERTEILRLAQELASVEAQYEHLRSLFGPSAPTVSSDLWLPPSGATGGPYRAPTEEDNLPTSWPLTEAGFVTQALAEGEAGDHPGLDIAVPADSYVRAAGAGRVVRIGEDPTYGLFVVLDHGGGYQSVYAHASALLVDRGSVVRKDEVIALSGSTGQSTAPHLHFEILLEGSPVDPLSMVSQPS